MAGIGLVRGLGRVSGAVLAGLFVLHAAAHAATPQRIASVDSKVRVALTNGVSPRVRMATDLGAAPADRKLEMALRFSLTASQQTALTQLIADQQNPASSRYHQWLTPEQFAGQFGLASSDVAKVTNWLTAEGFTVTKVSRGGLFVRFSGTVAQANKSFSTEIERVSVSGEEHIANLTAPSLPAALAGVTSSISGLDDFAPKPRPMYTAGNGAHYLVPGDLYTIYDVQGLLSSNVNGSGVTIAVVGQTEVQVSDVAAFRAAAGLSVNTPTVMLYGADPGSGNASDVRESTVDLEWAGAMAPSAKVIFVTATNVFNGSITEVIDNNLAPIIANSYGMCEASVGLTDLAYYQTLLQQGASQGITLVSSAGDNGATDCDTGTTARSGFAVDYPASSPYTTGVGGTEFNEGTGTYWNATNASNGSSAKSYIPETAWNDTGTGALASGGGGASLVFPKPSWQIGSGVPVDASRDVPDVAFTASGNHDPYIFCLGGACTNGFTNAGGSFTAMGGTSVASPVFAGLMALVVQKQGRVGVANNTLYALANSTYASNVFHDVTSGNNNSPCNDGTTDCPAGGGTIGFTAGVGYDQATGWGSVDAMNLVNDWGLVTPFPTTPAGLTSSITNLTTSAGTAQIGASVTLTATVSSGSSTVTTAPTGTITFTVDSVVVGTTSVGSNGVGTFTLDTSSYTVGTHKLQATYGGDATYYGSKAAFSLVLTGAASTSPDFTLTPANVALGVSAGTLSQPITYSVIPRNGFTGTVKFDVVYSAQANITKIFSLSSVTISGTTPATTMLTLAAYTGGDLAEMKAKPFGWQGAGAGAGVVLAGVLILLLPVRRRRVPALMLVVLSGTALMAMNGCAGDGGTTATSSTNSTKTNAATGTYALKVTATSTVNGTAVTHTSNVTLSVQ